MDIIERHFAAENAHDVPATLDTYSDDIVWDDITHPDSPFCGKEEVGQVLERDRRQMSRCSRSRSSRDTPTSPGTPIRNR